MTFSSPFQDFLRAFFGLFQDFSLGLSQDFLRIFFRLSQIWHQTFSGLSQDFLGLSQDFLRTFQDFLRNFSGLENFPVKFSGLSPDFPRTPSELSQDLLSLFPWISHRTFSGLSQNFLKTFRTFTQRSQEFLGTFFEISQEFFRTF